MRLSQKQRYLVDEIQTVLALYSTNSSPNLSRVLYALLYIPAAIVSEPIHLVTHLHIYMAINSSSNANRQTQPAG